MTQQVEGLPADHTLSLYFNPRACAPRVGVQAMYMGCQDTQWRGDCVHTCCLKHFGALDIFLHSVHITLACCVIIVWLAMLPVSTAVSWVFVAFWQVLAADCSAQGSGTTAVCRCDRTAVIGQLGCCSTAREPHACICNITACHVLSGVDGCNCCHDAASCNVLHVVHVMLQTDLWQFICCISFHHPCRAPMLAALLLDSKVPLLQLLPILALTGSNLHAVG